MVTSGLSLFTSQDLPDFLLLKPWAPAPSGCTGRASRDLDQVRLHGQYSRRSACYAQQHSVTVPVSAQDLWPDSSQPPQRLHHDLPNSPFLSDTTHAARGGQQQLPSFLPFQPLSLACDGSSPSHQVDDSQQCLDSPLVEQEIPGVSAEARSSAEQQTLYSSPRGTEVSCSAGDCLIIGLLNQLHGSRHCTSCRMIADAWLHPFLQPFCCLPGR